MTTYKVVPGIPDAAAAKWLLVVVDEDGAEWPSLIFNSEEEARAALDRYRILSGDKELVASSG